MASLINLSVCLTDIDKSRIQEGKNGKKYINLTVSVNDEANEWGNNVSAWHGQSQEERENKANRMFLGNGKVVWTTGVISKPDEAPSAPVKDLSEDSDDLPF